jgi:Sulfotransferase family
MIKLRPIFVVGAARSGTTMLGSILGSAEGVLATPESQFIADLIAKAKWPGGILDPEVARSCLVSHSKFQIWGVDDNAVFSRIERPTTLRELIEQLVLAYGGRRDWGGGEIWVDHTPESLFILPYLRRAFTDARFIHLVRDGRAVGASILPLDVGPVDIFDAALGWTRQIAAGLAAETSSLFEGRIQRVYYESLVSDPSTTVAGLCEFCDIAFAESMIEGKGFLVPCYTRNQHTLVGSRPQKERATRWKSELSLRQIEIFEAEAGGLLQLIGYPTRFWPNAVARTRYEAWSSRLRKFLLRPYNRTRREWRIYRHFQHMKGASCP